MVWRMRRGSESEGPDSRVRPHSGTVKRRETGTAPDYGPGIYIRIHILYRTVRVRFWYFLWLIGKKAAEWPDPSPVLGSGPSRIGSQSSSHCILLNARWPRWSGQSRKTTTGPKSGFKEMKSFEIKHKMLASSGSQRMRNHNWWRICDSDPDPRKSTSTAKLKGISPGRFRGWSPDPDQDCVTTNQDRGPTHDVGHTVPFGCLAN